MMNSIRIGNALAKSVSSIHWARLLEPMNWFPMALVSGRGTAGLRMTVRMLALSLPLE